MNKAPLLACPPTVTTTVPVVVPVGTGVTIVVVFQLVGVAVMPLNFKVLEPCVAPKLVPPIVTTLPGSPEFGERLVICGVIVKERLLLATPPTLTTTGPLVAPLGTNAVMLVGLQLLAVAAVPLNMTELEPWVEPKFEPVIVTAEPIGPMLGESDDRDGGGSTAGTSTEES